MESGGLPWRGRRAEGQEGTKQESSTHSKENGTACAAEGARRARVSQHPARRLSVTGRPLRHAHGQGSLSGLSVHSGHDPRLWGQALHRAPC